MTRDSVLLHVRHLTGDLTPGPGGAQGDLVALRHRLADLLHRYPGVEVTGTPQPHEGGPVGPLDAEAADIDGQIASVFGAAAAADGAATPLVFRRETAFRTPHLGASASDWSAAMTPTESLGPFADSLGRPIWFDIFAAVALVDVSFQGGAAPVLRLPLTGPLLGGATYALSPGSAWIASSLIAQDPALAARYTGLRITGGTLTLSTPATVSGGALVLDAGAAAVLTLQLDPPAPAPDPAAVAGLDAAAAIVHPPASLTLNFTATTHQLVAATADCKVFGSEVTFTPAAAPPSWVAALGQILVPYDVAVAGPDPTLFTVAGAKSTLSPLAGAARLRSPGGWLLPAVQLPPAQLGDAAGVGALAFGLRKGLNTRWRGLKGGDVALDQPIIIAEPGQITVLDLGLGAVRGRQRWTLWKTLHGAHHTDITFSFGKTFAFIWVATSADSEGLFYFCGQRANIDRPLDGQGVPFRVQSDLALAGMLQQGATVRVALIDTALSPDPAGPGASHALMLRNAYFKVTGPAALLLAGELAGDDTVVSGALALSFAYTDYLPTLPDPYAASYTGLFDRRRPGDVAAAALGGLAAFVKWKPATGRPADDNPAHLRFRFIAAPTGQASLAATGLKLATVALAPAPAPSAQASLPAAAPAVDGFPQVPVLEDSPEAEAAIARIAAHPLSGGPAEAAVRIRRTLALAAQADPAAPFSTRGGDLGPTDVLTLLDVSTHADQMGVSLGPALDVVRGRDGAVTLTPAADPSPLWIEAMEVMAPARYLRALTLPQVSWEPVWNVPLAIHGPPDPPDLITVAPGPVLYPNDGIPTRFFSESSRSAAITPLSVTEHFLGAFNHEHHPRPLRALFGLPFGIVSLAEFERHPKLPAAKSTRLAPHRPWFGDLHGALQIGALAPDSAKPDVRSPEFPGFTLQLDNIHSALFGIPLPGSTLGKTVKTIFNQEFAVDKPKVPLERIEFSGYGASMFSDWRDHDAAIAEVSQARFDVMVGRTAHEVVQIRSMLYPFGVHVVRTITLMRSANGYVFRSDSGWKAESDGFYDFDYVINFDSGPDVAVTNPYVVHARPVKGVSNVREIRDNPSAGDFTSSFRLDDPGLPPAVLGLSVAQLQALFSKVTPKSDFPPLKITSKSDVLPVRMQAVSFDADVHLDNVVSGGRQDPVTGDDLVQSRQMLGYVQLSPAALLVPSGVFDDLLRVQGGSLGGPVDCTVDLGVSGQRMRLSRVDVSAAPDTAGGVNFVSAARGSLILPGDGAWSVVVQRTDTGDVQPVTAGLTVPVIQPNGQPNLRLANPADAVVVDTSQVHYGVLQSTGTQKLLFDAPFFTPGQALLKSGETYFADAYKLLNSKGVFPNVANALGLTPAERSVEIAGEGLMKLADRTLDLSTLLPANYQYAFIDEPGVLKVYAEYRTNDPSDPTPGHLGLGIDSTAANLADRWKSALSDISVVVDLGPFERLMWVDGNFNAASAIASAYDKPHLQFGKVLDPVVNILYVLSKLSGDDFDSGMDVGMSNSVDNWEYKFDCSKEIPVIKFPSPLELTINPNPPLKLEAGLKVGFYFNEVLSIPTDLKQLAPAAGAYVQFYGRMEVQCFTLAAASVYGVGQVTLGIAADSKAGVTVDMKFGFGAEVVVGLPVVANVGVLYMAEVEVSINGPNLLVAGMLLFKGSAEICGGLVAICIQIEAGGGVSGQLSGPTYVEAQVSFSIDVCVLWVIDIDYHDSWQEKRQIA